MILDTVRQQLIEAIKQKDEVRMSTLRLLVSALEYKKTQKGEDLSESDEVEVIKSEVKKRQEAIEIYSRHQDWDRVETEKAELSILEQFLPEQASEDEIRSAIEALKKELGDEVNRGQLIGRVIAKFDKGAVDGSLVAKLVNQS